MINESGTMSGGGGKPRGGRMCLGKAMPRSLDTQAAAAELQSAEQELSTNVQVCILLAVSFGRLGGCMQSCWSLHEP